MLDPGRREEPATGVSALPHIPVTLIAIDTSDKVALTERAIAKCQQQATFADVKLLTDQPREDWHVQIGKLDGLEGYSNFVARDLYKHFSTSHALLVQHDGYVLNGQAWDNQFLAYDYIGAPWLQWGKVGNGGFSLRSRRLLGATANLARGQNAHPEDSWICIAHRRELEAQGISFASIAVAARFAFEGRSYRGKEWQGLETKWSGQFGFHSWLTPLPAELDRPLIFHHSGDAGDVIYAAASMKALGGGILFLSPDNRYPYSKPTRWQQGGAPIWWVTNLNTLLEHQPYVWRALYTHGLPYSVDFDLNSFRQWYERPNPHVITNIYRLHQMACGIEISDTEPWLTVDGPREIPDRPIVVNRTVRFHNAQFPWRTLVNKYGKRMAFIGDFQEAALFQQEFGFTPRHIKTENLLEAARVIAGAKVFIGNQSCPLAIAHGLGKRVIVEEWRENPNCHLQRPGALYPLDQNVDIPEAWL